MTENKYNEKYITMCQNMRKRKTLNKKNQALSEISQMMAMLGYKSDLVDMKNMSGKSMISYKKDDFKYLIVADYNVRDVMYLNCRQKINGQSENNRNQLLNLTLILIATLIVAICGVYIVFKLGSQNKIYIIIGALVILLSLLIPRRQDMFNASKNAALYFVFEVAKQLENDEVAFCFVNETGNEQGLTNIEKEYPNIIKIYINQISNEDGLYIKVKRIIDIYENIRDLKSDNLKIDYEKNENDDCLIRQFSKGILITTCDLDTLTCKMPGTVDDETNLDRIDQIIEIIKKMKG